MKRFSHASPLYLQTTLASLALLASTGCSALGIRTVEEAGYSVVREEGNFELRQYEELVVVETSVNAGYDDAGGIAFGRLFGYISGDNVEQSKIAMTAPVLSEPRNVSEGTKIAMTAPVLTEAEGEAWTVSFVLPSEFSLETAPLPTNPQVELATIPSKLVAAVRFSGKVNEASLREREQELRAWLEESALTPTSGLRSAGYDPPWTPSPLRRNEVLIDVEQGS